VEGLILKKQSVATALAWVPGARYVVVGWKNGISRALLYCHLPTLAQEPLPFGIWRKRLSERMVPVTRLRFVELALVLMELLPYLLTRHVASCVVTIVVSSFGRAALLACGVWNRGALLRHASIAKDHTKCSTSPSDPSQGTASFYAPLAVFNSSFLGLCCLNCKS
jgi:hypothetical protein